MSKCNRFFGFPLNCRLKYDELYQLDLHSHKRNSMKAIPKFYAFLLCFPIIISTAQELTFSELAKGFEQPVGLENAGDGRLFVLEQPGVIRIVDTAGNKLAKPFLDITDRVLDRGNEQGLLGLAFHPEFKENGLFYLNYTKSGGATVVSQFSLSSSDDEADPGSEKVLLEIDQPYANHNGGCIAFGPDGCLYIGMGDGGWAGDPKQAGQDKKALLGKILRIDVQENGTYKIPVDNPFSGNSDYSPEIWAMGVRNPWRFSFDAFNGDMWMADVGQDKWEEVNYQAGSSIGGENYGWRCKEGDHNYRPNECSSSDDLVDPVFEYSNDNTHGCSITGGYVYRGSKYKSLFGKYIVTDYCSGNIWTIDMSGDEPVTTLLGRYTRNNYSSFGTDADGELYLCERETGKIIKIHVDECKPVAHFYGIDNTVIWTENKELKAGSGSNLSYEWFLNNEKLPASANSLVPAETGTYKCIVTNQRGCKDTIEVFIEKIISNTREVDALSEAELFPNPANQSVRIKIPEDWPEVDRIELTDLNGKRVILNKPKTGSLDYIDMSLGGVSNGNYLIQVYAGQFVWNQKLTVKH